MCFSDIEAGFSNFFIVILGILAIAVILFVLDLLVFFESPSAFLDLVTFPTVVLSFGFEDARLIVSDSPSNIVVSGILSTPAEFSGIRVTPLIISDKPFSMTVLDLVLVSLDLTTFLCLLFIGLFLASSIISLLMNNRCIPTKQNGIVTFDDFLTVISSRSF